MAAATVNAPSGTHANPRQHANQLPLSDCNFYRWSLTAGNGDTHATGLSGIVETAITGTRTPGLTTTPAVASGNIRISSIGATGIITFAAAGSTTFDLLVWAK